MTTETQPTKPQTVAEKATELYKTNPGAQTFVLFKSGPGSDVIAIGDTYEAMWQHGAERMGIDKAQMLKNGYVFDVMNAKDARRAVNQPVQDI